MQDERQVVEVGSAEMREYFTEQLNGDCRSRALREVEQRDFVRIIVVRCLLWLSGIVEFSLSNRCRLDSAD